MLKPNRIVIKLIGIDFFLHGGWGFIGPVFAIFVTQQIEGSSIEALGLAVGLFWIIKSAIQPFAAYKMDLVKGEKDDITALFRGIITFTLVTFCYIFITQMWHVFVLEAIRGVAMAFVVPPWSGMLTRHVDKDWKAYTWSLNSTAIGIALGFSAIFGSMIAAAVGFKMVFVFVTVMGMISTTFVYMVRKDIFAEDAKKQESS